MPDLVTHASVAYLLSIAVPRARPALVVAGSFAPDLLCRVPALALSAVHTHVHPLPAVLLYGWDPLHTPVGMALSAYLLALLFRTERRPRVFWNLLAGMLLHLSLDLTQHHYGVGHALLFPLSFRTFELGWLGSEDSVFAAPVLALASAIAWWVRRRNR